MSVGRQRPQKLDPSGSDYLVHEDDEEPVSIYGGLARDQISSPTLAFTHPALKDLAKSKFEMAMACYYDSPEFADAIEDVRPSTTTGLRDVVLQAFRSHPRLASTQDVSGVIKRTPTKTPAASSAKRTRDFSNNSLKSSRLSSFCASQNCKSPKPRRFTLIPSSGQTLTGRRRNVDKPENKKANFNLSF
jgi:hypothetical protein